MGRSNIFEDITLSSRYECKYLINPLLISQVRDFIRPFMRPDHYAAMREGYRYPICSLYLDSDDLALYQQTVSGEKNRFKLRVRTYSDDPRRAVFFEVKRKINNIVQKRRARLTREQAVLLLAADGIMLRTLPPDLLSDVEYFSHLASLTDCKPVIKVKYMREAYESRGGDPLRLTIDTDLMHAITLNQELSHASGRWTTTPVDGAILELKFTERFPAWITDLVHAFGLKQQPVPKYIWSMDHVLLGGRESALSIAGFTLPPRRL